jgi:hypothetical protein
VRRERERGGRGGTCWRRSKLCLYSEVVVVAILDAQDKDLVQWENPCGLEGRERCPQRGLQILIVVVQSDGLELCELLRQRPGRWRQRGWLQRVFWLGVERLRHEVEGSVVNEDLEGDPNSLRRVSAVKGQSLPLRGR